MLDFITQLLGISDILRFYVAYAFYMHSVELQRDTKSGRRHNHQLVRRVDAVDIKTGIHFGIAEALRVGQRGRETALLFADLGQYVVRGTVDNTDDGLDTVGRQRLPNRLDDRHPASDRRLVADHRPVLLRGGEQLVAVVGNQCLIRGYHMFRMRYRLHD